MNSKTEVPDKLQDQTVKWSPDHLDCGLSEIGKKQVSKFQFIVSQCETQEEAAHKYDVDYVFSSPMRRCLATTYSLFKNHPSKPKIIVLPFLREEFQSSCDVGCKILESKALFPTFDFSFLDQLSVDPNIWYVETIYNKEKQEKILEKMKEQCKEKEDYQTMSPQIMIDFMKELFPETLESREEMTKRAIEVKKVLLPKALNKIALDKQVAIVAHSQFLFNFTAESFDDKFKQIGAKWFANCEIRPFELEM